jgi:hypothetical protein
MIPDGRCDPGFQVLTEMLPAEMPLLLLLVKNGRLFAD